MATNGRSAREDFFARAGFTGNQNRSRRRRRQFRHAHHFLHGFRPAHQFAQAPRFAQLFRECGNVALIAHPAQRAVQERAQNGGLQRFLDEPECPCLNRFDFALLAAVARNDDGGDGFQLLSQLAQKLDAIHARQTDVGQQRGGTELGIPLQYFFRAGTPQHLVAPAAEHQFVAAPGIVLVFYHEDAVFYFLLRRGNRARSGLGFVRHPGHPWVARFVPLNLSVAPTNAKRMARSIQSKGTHVFLVRSAIGVRDGKS